MLAETHSGLLVQADPRRTASSTRILIPPTSSTWADGKIGLLDFGLSGFLREDDLEEGVRLLPARHGRGHIRDQAVTEAAGGALESLGRRGGDADHRGGFQPLLRPSLSNVDVTSLLHQVFDIVYSLRLRLPSRFLLLDKALLTMEGVVGELYPDLNVFELAGRYTGSTEARATRSAERARTVCSATLAEYAEVLRDYPLQLHDLLEEMRAGELEIKYRHTGLEDVIHRLDVIMNRLVVALVSIALGVRARRWRS